MIERPENRPGDRKEETLFIDARKLVLLAVCVLDGVRSRIRANTVGCTGTQQ